MRLLEVLGADPRVPLFLQGTLAWSLVVFGRQIGSLFSLLLYLLIW
jgi:hypothetical protein